LEYDPEIRRLFPNIPGPSSAAEPHIVGGDEAVPNSRPYQVGGSLCFLILEFVIVVYFVRARC